MRSRRNQIRLGRNCRAGRFRRDEHNDSFLKHGIVARNNGGLPNAKIQVDDAFDFRSRYVYVGAADHGLEARFAGLIGLIDTPMPFSANERTKTSG